MKTLHSFLLVLTVCFSYDAFGFEEKNKHLLFAPSLTSFTPTSGTAGTVVTVFGSNFSATASANIVKVNGINVVVTSASQNALSIVIPVGATSGAISVTIGNETVTSSSIFTVLPFEVCNGISINNARHWYFGNQAAIQFDVNGPISLSNSAMTQVEGVATMSDANGNLLFYTDGITIFNKNHQTMLNGTGLLSNSSNTQAAFIVPFPSNPNLYYLITPNPYYFSIIDMTLDNGNGAVVPTAKNILLSTESSEKIAGLYAVNQTDIWLVTYGATEMRFNVYKITPTEITPAPVVSQFTTASGYFGYMKVSPDGTKIVTANFANSFHLYDFNTTTGIVSNQRIINYAFGGFGSYGIEFSPDNNSVYVADHRGPNKVVQFDITLSTPESIAASAVTLSENAEALGALQLGPDNKIYVAKENCGHLGVIDQPNADGVACNYLTEGFAITSGTSNLGLPGFVASSLVKNEPYITSFSPSSGTIGTTVTLSGLDFIPDAGTTSVVFNNIVATIVSVTSTSITVNVPSDATNGKLSVISGCGLVTSTDDFTVIPLSIAELNTLSLTISPNPSNGIFKIDGNFSGISEITLYDISGNLIHQSKQNLLENNVLDFQRLQSGVYLVKVVSEGKSFTQKIVRK